MSSELIEQDVLHLLSECSQINPEARTLALECLLQYFEKYPFFCFSQEILLQIIAIFNEFYRLINNEYSSTSHVLQINGSHIKLPVNQLEIQNVFLILLQALLKTFHLAMLINRKHLKSLLLFICKGYMQNKDYSHLNDTFGTNFLLYLAYSFNTSLGSSNYDCVRLIYDRNFLNQYQLNKSTFKSKNSCRKLWSSSTT